MGISLHLDLMLLESVLAMGIPTALQLLERFPFTMGLSMQLSVTML
jgi:hypothetical protein